MHLSHGPPRPPRLACRSCRPSGPFTTAKAAARTLLVGAAAFAALQATLAADDPAPLLRLDPGGVPFFTTSGSATWQGDAVTNADTARAIFGVSGAGVRLGVISDSFLSSGSATIVNAQIAAGDLPGAGNPAGRTTPVTVVKDDSGTDEGRAMLEIVHDVAPGALLSFHSAFNNTNPATDYTSSDTPAPDQTIADAIAALAAQPGMRIIVDDVFIVTQPRFQDGAAAKAAAAAVASGIGYFSSAGNSASNATRVTTSAATGGTVNWGTNDLLQMTIGANTTARVMLQWAEPYTSVSGPATTSDFAISATSLDGSMTYFTVNNQFTNEDPYEFAPITYSGGSPFTFAFRVTRLSGTAPVLMQLSTFGDVAITDADDTNSPTVSGQAAAVGAVAVAAAPWFAPDSVESFSSRGPTLILFDAAGNPVNQVRQTPLITAPDGGSTTTAGFSSFYGTSAAAPHAAAVAALVLERFDQKGLTVSPADLAQVLFDSAVDMGTAGVDAASGYGRIDALAAVSAGRVWDGNGATAGVAGSGTWSQAAWTLETSGDKPTGRFIRGQQAVFGSGTAAASTYTITVDGTYDVAGLSFSRDAVTLSPGGGTLRLTSPGVAVSGSLTAVVGVTLSGTVGLTKTGAGKLVVGGSQAYTGPTLVEAGLLTVNGTLAGSPATVSASGTLGGHGALGGRVAGAGAVAPGNSPGILTVGSVDPSAGLDFAFEFSGTAANLSSPTASINDVLRVTDPTTPFTSILGGGNVVDVYFGGISSLAVFDGLVGVPFSGGFLTTSAIDLLDTIGNASFRYWFVGDGGGDEAWHGGAGYYGLSAFDPGGTRTFAVGTAAAGDGGLIMTLTGTILVPEPTTASLALAAAVGISAWIKGRGGRRAVAASRSPVRIVAGP